VKTALTDLLVAMSLPASKAEPLAALLIEVADPEKLYATLEEYRRVVMYRASYAHIALDHDTAQALAVFAHALVSLGDVLAEMEVSK
jgi:hypothetical protein